MVGSKWHTVGGNSNLYSGPGHIPVIAEGRGSSTVVLVTFAFEGWMSRVIHKSKNCDNACFSDGLEMGVGSPRAYSVSRVRRLGVSCGVSQAHW